MSTAPRIGPEQKPARPYAAPRPAVDIQVLRWAIRA
ncbi:Uncharacterised protein [Mycobacteroides abscessus subsp. abscessus]|nr:Uncharacterised protein [Mycobacteroides abscessus subsp. abscessus]